MFLTPRAVEEIILRVAPEHLKAATKMDWTLGLLLVDDGTFEDFK